MGHGQVKLCQNVQVNNGKKNLIGERLKILRKQNGLSQRDLAHKLELEGLDIDKNVITRIEMDKRYVTDIEIQVISRFFRVSYEYLLDGIDSDKK